MHEALQVRFKGRVFDGESLILTDQEVVEGAYGTSSAWLTETESMLLAWEVDPLESWEQEKARCSDEERPLLEAIDPAGLKMLSLIHI